jgi:hypothetical protein
MTHLLRCGDVVLPGSLSPLPLRVDLSLSAYLLCQSTVPSTSL